MDKSRATKGELELRGGISMVSNYKVLDFVVALEECFISDIFAKKKVIEFRSEDFEERIIRAHISGREIDNIYMIMYQKQNANM